MQEGKQCHVRRLQLRPSIPNAVSVEVLAAHGGALQVGVLVDAECVRRLEEKEDIVQWVDPRPLPVEEGLKFLVRLHGGMLMDCPVEVDPSLHTLEDDVPVQVDVVFVVATPVLVSIRIDDMD